MEAHSNDEIRIITAAISRHSEKQIELARDYFRKFFISAGMCADLCIHDKVDGNPHAHIMLTMRPFEPYGSWAAKCKRNIF